MRWTIGASFLAAAAMAGGCLQVMGWEEARPGWKGDGGAASGGSGGAGSCKAGETKSCYGGPAGTEGVGICKAGTAICKGDGSGFGACEGEVGPTTEDYTKPEDEDCDGYAGSTTLWATQLHNVQTTGIAADPVTGAVYVAGSFSGTAKVGNETFTSAAGKSDTLLIKVDGAGKPTWAMKIGNVTAGGGGVSIAFHNHMVTVVSFSDGTFTLNGDVVPKGIFVVRLDEEGAFQWVSNCAGFGYQYVAIDPTNGDAILAGSLFEYQCGTQQYFPHPDRDIFITRLSSATGVESSTKQYWGGQFNYAYTVATDSFGNAFFGGWVDTALSLGSNTFNDGDTYVAKASSFGLITWARAYPGGVGSIATSPTADVFIHAGLRIRKASGSDGTVLWDRDFGVVNVQTKAERDRTVAVSSKGDLAIGATVTGAVTLDGHTVTQTGFVSLLDGSTGTARWVDSFNMKGASVAFSKNDALAVTASFGPGTSDFGTGPLTTEPGETDSVVFLIAP